MSILLDFMSLISTFVGQIDWHKVLQFIVQTTLASLLIYIIGWLVGIFNRKSVDISFPKKGKETNYSCNIINKTKFQIQDCEVKISINHNESDILGKTDLCEHGKSAWDTDGAPFVNKENPKIVEREFLPFSDTGERITKKNINRNDSSKFDVIDVDSKWNYFRVFSEKKYKPPRVYLRKKQYSGVLHISAKDFKGKNVPIIIDPFNEKHPIVENSKNIFVKFRNWVCSHICENNLFRC